MNTFELVSQFSPSGDQPQAIEKLSQGILSKKSFQTLLGVTGSGKTFTVANVIAQTQKPTLILAHNKTLAAQLAQEFRAFFPKNAVEYFVSYYDYYQPEAYVSATDTYIEKEAEINEEIDRLRHSATAALLSRRDVIVVASVSCIYGLGTPEWYEDITLKFSVGDTVDREEMIDQLILMHYTRSELLSRSKFRLRGPVIEIMAPSKEIVTRIEIQGGSVQKIVEYDFLTGETLTELEQVYVYPAKHFIVPEREMGRAVTAIQTELKDRLAELHKQNKLLEAQRLEHRTRQDIEMIREVGYCNGIENYSRHLTGRNPGEAPYTLIDYLPEDYMLVIDESHVTIPQVGGMYNGDRARKQSLIENGFRLPSALDNRPLKFEEFEKRMGQTIFVSATPSRYEAEHSHDIVEQIIRPTGLVDPEVQVRPAKTQVKDLLQEIPHIQAKGERVLVTALTKKMAEDLAEHLKELEIPAKYLHSDIDTLERIKTLEELRKGEFDVLVGVNLLREGLDLPEVSLVAILDADKEGFLRSEMSLIQTMGRAARNVSGKVLLYADKMTVSMQRAIDETNRRRKIQLAYNKKNGITPQTIKKEIASIVKAETKPKIKPSTFTLQSDQEILKHIKYREKEMKQAAKDLEFERAALIRDEIHEMRKLLKR